MQGWLRFDGGMGIRNVVAVAYLVECAHHVAREVAGVRAPGPKSWAIRSSFLQIKVLSQSGLPVYRVDGAIKSRSQRETALGRLTAKTALQTAAGQGIGPGVFTVRTCVPDCAIRPMDKGQVLRQFRPDRPVAGNRRRSCRSAVRSQTLHRDGKWVFQF